MKKITILAISLLIIFGLSLPAFSQGFDASGISMAGAYIALARGVDAFAWNPANLSLSHINRFEINLVGARADLANSSLTITEYKRYFTESGHQGYWSESDIDHLLAMIPEEGLQTAAEAQGNAIGLMFGRYGVSAQVIGHALGLIPKSVFELGLLGNQELYKEFNVDDLAGDAFSAVKFSLSLSHPITVNKFFEEFAVGLNVNYFKGLAEVSITEANGSFITTEYAILTSLDVTTRNGKNGDGLGFDLGAAGKVNDRWTVGMAFYNVLAAINWKQELEERRTYFLVDSIQLGEFEDGSAIDTTITQAIDPYTTSLPLVFHIGVGYQFLDNLVFALDLEQAFEKKMGYSDRALLAIGVQYTPVAIVPLRAGMSFGGIWDYRLALGFGLHLAAFNLDLAYAMHKGLWPTAATGASIAANIKIVF